MNLNAFPFYRNTSDQMRSRSCAAYKTGLFCSSNRFLPFVVKRVATGQGLDCIFVYDAVTSLQVRVILASDFPYSVFTDGEFDYYVYFGTIIANLNLACGEYFISVKEQFSEVFTVVDNISSYLKIEWSNSSDIEGLPYSKGFQQRLYLNTSLAEPIYKHEEEGEDDGDSVFVALEHRLTKGYKFDTLALPAFVVDVLQSLAIHDAVRIADSEPIREFEIDQTWSKDVCVATSSISFTEAPVLAAVCSPGLPLIEVDISGYVPKPWICGGDNLTTPFWERTGNFDCEQGDFVFRSDAISEIVTRNNCPANTTGGFIGYFLPEGHATSTVSQAEADRLAREYFDSTKQAYANANAECIPNNRVQIEGTDPYGNRGVRVNLRRFTTTGDVEVIVEVNAQIEVNNQAQAAQKRVSVFIPDGQLTAFGTADFFPAEMNALGIVKILSTIPNTYIFQ